MRSYIRFNLSLFAALVLALSACSSSSNGGEKDAGSDDGSGGSGGKNGGTGGKSGTGGKGGASGSGGKASTGDTDAGDDDAGGASGKGGPGTECTGKNDCYSCAPKSDVQFLDHCTDAQCEPFDNVKRLPQSYKPGEPLPAIP